MHKNHAEKGGNPGMHPTNGRLTLDDIRRDQEVVAFILSSNQQLMRMGYTEHGERHAGLVGAIAFNILQRCNYSATTYGID
ncbi:MAG: hypothetical protein EXR62_12825 [Chloroflexi bacterium]|nr:hypothetical protein [Chloroflexota bacterium]